MSKGLVWIPGRTLKAKPNVEVAHKYLGPPTSNLSVEIRIIQRMLEGERLNLICARLFAAQKRFDFRAERASFRAESVRRTELKASND